jgi:hypothetical protein
LGHRVALGPYIKSLRDGDEAHPGICERPDVREHVERRPAEPVQLPDEDRFDFALTRGLHDPAQARPIVPSARAGFLDVEGDGQSARSCRVSQFTPGETGILVARAHPVIDRAFRLAD